MSGEWIPIIIVPIIFIAFPWIILHYITKWKTRTALTSEDETMLDDLYDLARRLDDRMQSLERILADENPNWNPLSGSDRRPALSEERSDLESIESELRAMRTRKPRAARTSLAKKERA